MATLAATAISRMLVSSNPRSRKRFRAAERMRFRVSPALAVPPAGLIGGLRVGSIASRSVNVAKFRLQFPVAQQSQPFGHAMPVGGENFEGLTRVGEQRRPRKTLRPMSIALERVQAHEPGVIA